MSRSIVHVLLHIILTHNLISNYSKINWNRRSERKKITLLVPSSEDDHPSFIPDQAFGNSHLPSLGPIRSPFLHDHLRIHHFYGERVPFSPGTKLIDFSKDRFPQTGLRFRHLLDNLSYYINKFFLKKMSCNFLCQLAYSMIRIIINSKHTFHQ